MPALAELQRCVVAAVLREEETGADQWLVPGTLAPAERLRIYRVTSRENFALALEAAFPLLRALAGEQEFRQIAWAYQRAHPSRSGNLFFAGQRLAGFLHRHLEDTPDRHLIDVARLEWACQECLVAPDEVGGLDLQALSTVPAHRQQHLRFRLHPAVRLVSTRFPLFDAWRTWQAQGGGTLSAPAGPGPEWLLVRRLATGIELHRLPDDEFHWLLALSAGMPLGRLVEQEAEAGPDSGGWLARWAARGVIHSFVLLARADS